MLIRKRIFIEGISGFHHSVNDVFALLGCYAV
jgi:hypothetical protein